MAVKFLDNTGLGYFWSKIKAWCNATFAAITHNQASNTINAMTGYSKPNSSSAIAASDSLNSAIGKLEAKVDAVDNSNFVQKSGDTMTGNLTVSKASPRFDIKNPSIARGTAPESDYAGTEILGRDYNNRSTWALYHTYTTNKTHRIRLLCYNGLTTDSEYAEIGVGYDSSGNPYTNAPTPSSATDNSTKIATTAWVRTATGNTALNAATATALVDDSNYVHKTGNETITGKKTFSVNTNTDHGQIILKNTHYSTILRNDDGSFYILTTAQNDPDGGWTSARPFSFNNKSGIGAVNSYVPVRSGYAGNVHIFISKTGNDSNDGLTKETAVLTVDQALYLAQGYGISGELYLRFGPGNWGTIDISGNRFLARRIIISSTEYSMPNTVSAFTALTGNNEPPVFDVVALRNGYFHVNNITAIRIDMYNSYVIFAAVNKFANVRAFLALLEIQRPYIVYSPTGYNSEYIFFLSNSSYKHVAQETSVSNNKSKFATATTRDNFLLCEGNNYIKIWNGNSWEGSFTGNKFYANSLLHITSDSIAIDSIPGTNFTDIHTYGNVFGIKHGTPTIALINTTSVKGTAPSSTNYWTIHFSGNPNGTAINGSLVNNVGYIQCVQTASSHGVYLYAMKPEANNSTDNAVLGLVYDTSGNKYAYTNTPGDTSNTTHIATTAWVRRYCDTTVKYMKSVSVTGSGNAVTAASLANGTLTLTKGTTFLTSHQSLSNYVTLNGDQTITGTKTFSSSIYFPNSGGHITQTAGTNYMHIGTNDAHGYGSHLFLYANTVSSDSNLNGVFRLRAAKNNSYKDLVGYESGYLKWSGREIATNVDNQYLRLDGSSAYDNGSSYLATGKSFSGYTGKFQIRANNGSTAKVMDGRPDGTLLWNGNAIQVASDERLKTSISEIPEQVLNAWESVEWIRYKYKEDVNVKGEENCRYHTGLIAQQVNRNCIDVNILNYGLLCHDTDSIFIDDNTEEITDLWTVRYTEALCMEAAYQRRKNKILENRISELEKQVSDMLQILQNLTSSNG